MRVLVAVARNLKAIFTKKQDTASILKELVGGMKEALPKTKIQPEPPAVEAQAEIKELKEVKEKPNLESGEPKSTKNNSRKRNQRKNKN
jgi:hypothetical protein